MLKALLSGVPPEALKIALTLALAFFIGLEREERKQRETTYAFGGVRTFPLIGLVSYALALISAPQLMPWAVGFGTIGVLMALSYYHKLAGGSRAGLTTEISALATYVVGGLVQHEHYWIAATIGVLSVLLLELKKGLEDLTRHFSSNEIVTVAKFLVLAVVILPIVPDRELTRFHVNPFKTWLIVVAVSGVSFASYVLQRAFKDRGGILLSAILGGAYSSTVTTIVLARRAKEAHRPNLFAGGILTASSVMYARLVILVGLGNLTLAAKLAPGFGMLAVCGGLIGWVISRRNDESDKKPQLEGDIKNPLELGAAVLFALVFVVILVLTTLVREHLGRTGLYALSALMGLADVDPFVLGIAQTRTASPPHELAASAIVIAAASNNVTKAVYSYAFADRQTGRKSLLVLLAFALIGFIPLAWS